MSKLQFTLPFLRFKEFSDDYILIKLDQISELQKNGSLSKNDIHNEGKFKCILYGELFTTYDSIIKSESILSKTNKISKLLTNSNCIVFPSSSTTLVDFFPCSSIKTSGVMLGQDISCFFVNDKNSSDYLSYFFSKKSNKIKIFRLTEGSTINHLYGNYLKNFTMCISNNIKEQVKISKFLSLLDKHIELWERKLQLYLLKKKFIYYRLFKTLNEKIKLKDIFVEINEKTEYKNIILASVGKNGIRLKSDVFDKINVKADHKVKIAEKNYLIIGMGSKQIDSHMNLLFDNIGVSVAYKTFKLINELYNPKYLDMYLNHFNSYFSSLFMIVSARQGKTVNINDWFNLKISIHNKKNRDNIAIFGYRIDSLISKINKKINLLKNQKQYYLDKLFI